MLRAVGGSAEGSADRDIGWSYAERSKGWRTMDEPPLIASEGGMLLPVKDDAEHILELFGLFDGATDDEERQRLRRLILKSLRNYLVLEAEVMYPFVKSYGDGGLDVAVGVGTRRRAVLDSLVTRLTSGDSLAAFVEAQPTLRATAVDQFDGDRFMLFVLEERCRQFDVENRLGRDVWIKRRSQLDQGDQEE
jgi:hypothetical protein